MFLIEIAGGILIEKYRNGKSILESINNALALTTENVKLFLPSLVLVTIAIGFIEERYAASNTISGIRSGFTCIDSITHEDLELMHQANKMIYESPLVVSELYSCIQLKEAENLFF